MTLYVDPLWDVLPRIPWATLEAVADDVGPSFYLADVGIFEANYTRFLSAFESRYPRVAIGYSYKTNYLPSFIERAHGMGGYSEVVSWFEFEIALKLGVSGDRIIFNGPIKTPRQLKDAIELGAIVNVDSVAELQDVAEIAGRADRQISVGVRCYLGEEITGGSRFGIDLPGDEAPQVLEILNGTPNLQVSGLHCHHSGPRSAERFRRRTEELIRIHADALGDRSLAFIDVGGGFGSMMSRELETAVGSPTVTPEEYADAVCTPMAKAYGDDGPTLIVEPGMGLLADTMAFATRVETTKHLGGRNIAVVDGSVFNVKPLRGAIDLPVHISHEGGQAMDEPRTWTVVGHTCMEVDTVRDTFYGSISRGDYLLVENVGAYSTVLNAPFIRGTPPIVELVDGRLGRVLRRGGTAIDLLRSFEVER